jgi:hypothetical protein
LIESTEPSQAQAAYEQVIEWGKQAQSNAGWVQAAIASFSLGVLLVSINHQNAGLIAMKDAYHHYNQAHLSYNHAHYFFFKSMGQVLSLAFEPNHSVAMQIPFNPIERLGYTGVGVSQAWHEELQKPLRSQGLKTLFAFLEMDVRGIIAALQTLPVVFYPDFELHRITSTQSGLQSFYLHWPDIIVPLDGKSGIIHFLNAGRYLDLT